MVEQGSTTTRYITGHFEYGIKRQSFTWLILTQNITTKYGNRTLKDKNTQNFRDPRKSKAGLLIDI